MIVVFCQLVKGVQIFLLSATYLSRACLVQAIELNEKAEVQCPFRDDAYSCDSSLRQLEIKAVSYHLDFQFPACT